MSRRQAREIALQSLFQLDYNDCNQENIMANALEQLKDDEEFNLPKGKSLLFAETLFNGTRENIVAIDQLITEHSSGWTLDRMSGIDRNIIRLAVYELKFSSDELAPNIPINEAIDLAKKYGTDDSARFVNGILDSIIK